MWHVLTCLLSFFLDVSAVTRMFPCDLKMQNTGKRSLLTVVAGTTLHIGKFFTKFRASVGRLCDLLAFLLPGVEQLTYFLVSEILNNCYPSKWNFTEP